MIKIYFALFLVINFLFAASNVDKKIQQNQKILDTKEKEKETTTLKIKELADKITLFPGICRLPTLSAHDKSGCCGTCPHSKLLFPACLAVGVAQAAVKSVPANRNRGKMLLVFIFI